MVGISWIKIIDNQNRLVEVIGRLFPLSEVLGSSIMNEENNSS